MCHVLTRADLEKYGLWLEEDREAVVVPSSVPPEVTGQALALWNETAPADQSKHDYLFVLALLRKGVTRARARELLPLLPAGKMHRDKRGEDYWKSTLASVEKVFKDDEAALETVRSLKSKNAFDDASVRALARVHELDRALYEKALRRMRKKLRVPKLEAEVKRVLSEMTATDLDAIARCVVDDKRVVGWWLKAGSWKATKFSEFRAVLDGQGHTSARVCAELLQKPWILVNVPFGPEEPQPRHWNKDAARLGHEPKQGEHPMWDQVLRVVGRGLDGAVRASAWCQDNKITTGGGYLLHWVASLFQQPTVPLPYLFFFGEERVGKSTFHEVLKLLFATSGDRSPGYVIANESLENKGGFNGELAGAVLCVVEEIEVARRAHKRIKLWTTGQTILIHEKGATAYTQPNNLHFVQTGNALSDCPLLKGDTRITAAEVYRPEASDRIPKDELMRKCLAEAPAFLWTALHVKLPAMQDRLGVPVLETEDKKGQQLANRDPLEEFLDKTPEWLSWTDEQVCDKFLTTLDGRMAHEWDRARVLRSLPPGNRVTRRLCRSLLDLAPWKGTVKELLALVPQDWSSEVALSLALTKPLPGLSVEKGKSQGRRLLRVTKS